VDVLEGIGGGDVIFEEVGGSGTFREVDSDSCSELDSCLSVANELKRKIEEKLVPGTGAIANVEVFGGREDRHGGSGGTRHGWW